MRAIEGRIAVVTGVTSGIGRALVADLQNAGAKVIGVGRNSDRLEAVQRETGIEVIQADLAQRDQVASCIGRIRESVDHLDILVNNAAQCVYEKPSALSTDAWHSLVDTNLHAVIQMCSGLRGLMQAGADILNISSVTADFVPAAKFGPYALTKTALESFTESLRLELAPHGIRVGLIAPGLVDTEIYDKVEGFESTLAKLKTQSPDWLRAEDVSHAILWCLSRPEHVVVGDLTLLPRGQAR